MCQVTKNAASFVWALQQVQDSVKSALPFRGSTIICRHHSPFETQLLVYDWALVETEHLTMGHRITRWPELLIMSWVLSDTPSHKVGHGQQRSISKWKWYIGDQTWAGPGGTIKLHAYGFYSCYICCQSCTYSLMGVCPEEGKTRAWYWWFCTLCWHYSEADSCGITTPFWGKPWKTPVKGDLHSGHNLGQCIWSCILFGRINGQMYGCSLTYGL